MAGHEILIDGSGRTDGGVHAYGQVATFNWTGKIPVEKLMYVLNHRLPKDIYIKSLEPVSDDFHARFSAIGKCYTYKLYKSDTPSPLKRRHAYRVPQNIDTGAMAKAASY
ncbi:Pseudouridine synthase I, TruA like protein, partial [Aduncisulcus paluster]